MTYTKNLEQSIDNFFNTTKNFVSNDFQTHLETIKVFFYHKSSIGSICQEFTWQSVEKINKELIPFLSNQLQNDWHNIYNFIEDKISQNVLYQRKQNEFINQKYVDFQNKNSLKTVWKIEISDPDFLEKPIPSKPKTLLYTEDSGYGFTGEIDLPVNPTFADFWFAAENLYLKSTDLESKYISNYTLYADKMIVYFTSLN